MTYSMNRARLISSHLCHIEYLHHPVNLIITQIEKTIKKLILPDNRTHFQEGLLRFSYKHVTSSLCSTKSSEAR